MLIERILKEIRQAKQNMERLILQGQIDDFVTYKYLAGKIKGLQDAVDIIINTTKINEE